MQEEQIREALNKHWEASAAGGLLAGDLVCMRSRVLGMLIGPNRELPIRRFQELRDTLARNSRLTPA